MYSPRTSHRCRSSAISIWSRHSRRALPTQRSAIAFARGARTGVLMIRTPVAVNTPVEHGGELGVPVPDQEFEAVSVILEVHQEITGLLGLWGSKTPHRWLTCECAWRADRATGRIAGL